MKSCRTITMGMYRFGSLQLVQLLVVVIFGIMGGNAFAASFSADMVKTGDGQMQTGRFFLLDDHYRLDIIEDGQELNILVNRKSGKTRIVIPATKEYPEIENSSFRSVMNNPFEGYYMMCQRFEARTSGSETIDGIRCDKVIISSDGQDLVTAWLAKPYAFPIRMVNPATGDRAELKNITEGRIDNAKFQVPAGYTEKEDPAKKREREEAALPFVTTLVSGRAPWVRRIGPSGEMRVAVDPEKSVRIKFENLVQDESVFTIEGLRAGRPINLDCRRTTFSLKGKGRRDECLVGVQNQAEEIAIVVEKGKILAYVFAKENAFFSHEDMVESFFVVTGIRDSGREKFVDPKRQLRLNITSDSQDNSESKPKVTDVFTVTHPYGTSKPLSPGEDLAITVTGVSGDASGTIDLYTDRKKTEKIDSFRVDLEIPATPEAVVTFYKKAMTAKGWQPGMAMIQGPMGVLQLMKGKSQIMLKAMGSGQKSIVNLALVSR